MNTITTKNRKLEQFFYAHGVDFTDCSKDEEGLTVWTYENTPENERIVQEFHVAQNRRTKKGV